MLRIDLKGGKKRTAAALLAGMLLLTAVGCSTPAMDAPKATEPPSEPQSVSPPASAKELEVPAPTPAKPFRFVVMGDSRGTSSGTNEATLRSLLEKVTKLSPQPEFLLFTGDQVTGGADVGAQLAAWKDVVDDYLPLTVVYPALGNHEHDERIFTQSFNTLPKEQLPGYESTAYSFDYNNARFITLNTDRKNAKKQYIVDEQQRAWLEQQLKTSEGKMIFVQFHVPAYPIGAHLGESLDADQTSRDALWSLFDTYQVTAVLVGHEHNYNRRSIDSSFSGSGFSFQHQIYQVTVGGAGAPLSTSKQEMKQVVAGPKASYHFMVVDVNGSKSTFKTYDLQLNEIDSFTVER